MSIKFDQAWQSTSVTTYNYNKHVDHVHTNPNIIIN